jgi:hypothetical protein
MVGMMRAGFVVIAAAVAPAAIGCQQRTEILFGVVTDLEAPAKLDTVQLDVSRAGTGVVELQTMWMISGMPDQVFNLPGSFGVTGDGGLSLEADLIGSLNGNVIVERTAVLSLVDGQTLFYRMGLTASCVAMGPDGCGSGTTCVEGVCKDPQADSTQFPSFSDDLVDNLTCNSGTQFIDTDTDTPMTTLPGAGSCPSNLCTEGTCYNPPAGNKTGSPDAGMIEKDAGGTSGPDAHPPNQDGGAPDCSIEARTYQATLTCSNLCSDGYPKPKAAATIAIDAQGNGDYVADTDLGIDGTCTSTLQGACTATINCNITTGATGQAQGTLTWTVDGTASGNFGYQLTAPAACNPTCTVTLQ